MSVDQEVVAGRVARVMVPGSSANLGPGFDALGLALGVHDTVVVEALDDGAGGRPPDAHADADAPGAVVAVTGEGAGRVGLGEDSLVVRSVRALFHRAGVPQPRLRLTCTNGVPHGRGVGSSAAAVVAGVVAGDALLATPLAGDELLDLVCDLEGHPDNAAASLLGGLTLGWRSDSARRCWRAVRVEPHASIDVVLCVPGAELSTARARAMLPLDVPHGDAAHAAGRAALLVEALTRSPELLLEATQDRLHQAQRAAAMPESAELMASLRQAGHAAVISGAGPSVLVLCPGSGCADAASDITAAVPGWRPLRPGIARAGAAADVTGSGAGLLGHPVTAAADQGGRADDVLKVDARRADEVVGARTGDVLPPGAALGRAVLR